MILINQSTVPQWLSTNESGPLWKSEELYLSWQALLQLLARRLCQPGS